MKACNHDDKHTFVSTPCPRLSHLVKELFTVRTFLRTATLMLLLTLTSTQARGQSALDGFDPNANGVVRVVVVQPDGKILIGGFFY